MAKYRLSQVAKEDLIRIYPDGVEHYGMSQADLYFNLLLEYFERIVKNPFAFESVGYIRIGYRRWVCGSDSIYYKIVG